MGCERRRLRPDHLVPRRALPARLTGRLAGGVRTRPSQHQPRKPVRCRVHRCLRSLEPGLDRVEQRTRSGVGRSQPDRGLRSCLCALRAPPLAGTGRHRARDGLRGGCCVDRVRRSLASDRRQPTPVLRRWAAGCARWLRQRILRPVRARRLAGCVPRRPARSTVARARSPRGLRGRSRRPRRVDGESSLACRGTARGARLPRPRSAAPAGLACTRSCRCRDGCCDTVATRAVQAPNARTERGCGIAPRPSCHCHQRSGDGVHVGLGGLHRPAGAIPPTRRRRGESWALRLGPDRGDRGGLSLSRLLSGPANRASVAPVQVRLPVGDEVVLALHQRAREQPVRLLASRAPGIPEPPPQRSGVRQLR